MLGYSSGHLLMTRHQITDAYLTRDTGFDVFSNSIRSWKSQDLLRDVVETHLS